MTKTEKTMKKIKDCIVGNNINRLLVSRHSGVPHATIRLMESEDWNPRASTLIKLEKFVKGVKITESEDV